MKPLSFLILTKNERENLPHALASVVGWAQDVFVVDSGSVDGTQELAVSLGATLVEHPWEGFAKQKNWAIDNLPWRTPWIFILDADEVVLPALREELVRIAEADNCSENGFYVNRFFIFLGQRIRHCGYYPSWNLRFFRRGMARYEEREVHEHMVVDGGVGYLEYEMEHNDRRGLEHYIAKHNHYSTLEARELLRVERGTTGKTIAHNFWGGPIARRRWIKQVLWPHMPARSLMRFSFMYFARLGLLDGMNGLHFCLFMAAYEHQISLKLKELRNA